MSGDRNNGSTSPPKYPLVIFDMDGVLTDHISSWMFMHTHFSVDNEQGYDDYKAGKIDDLEFMSQDIRLWRKNQPGITVKEVSQILNKVPLMPGTRQTLHALRKHGVKTAIISGGLEQLALRLKNELGIDQVRRNGLEYDGKGKLTGVGILRVSLRSKDEVVREVCRKMKIPAERAVAIGDTRIDASMLKMCGLGIAFDPKDDATRESADVIIHKKDLREILHFVL